MRGPDPRADATAARRRTRSIALAVVAIVAVVLAAAWVAAGGSGRGGGGGGPSPTGSALASGSPGASARATPTSGSSPASSDATLLVGAGDIAVCGSDDDEATAALVEGLPGTVFTLGDNAYGHGSDQEFRDCFGPSWGRFKDRIGFPVPGNHEYGTSGAAGYRAYFGTAAAPEGETWYSRDVGGWHVIVLDATCDKVPGGCGPGSPQLDWLRADLAASTARCTLAMWHQPRFSSGFHGNDLAVAPFWDLLYAAGADLVLNGHDHNYERFAPQAPDESADPARGITEIVAGTGGAALRPFETSLPNRVVGSDAAHGVVELALGPSGWTTRFVSTDSPFSDDASGTCH